MKTIKQTHYIVAMVLAFVIFMGSCKKDDPAIATPATPDYQLAIEAKYKAMGWDKDGHTPFNGSAIVKTPAGKGYVQYYAFGSRKTAIYYFDGKGAFAMDTSEMTKYDALGGDNFAYVTSDPKPSGTGSGYNEIIKISDNSAGIIITTPNVGTFVEYGEIYKKYLAVNRWDGPLGYPLNDELDLGSKKGRWSAFAKTGNTQTGQIYYNTTTGAQAFWGKVEKMYGAAGYDGGWLGLPTTSCDPNVIELKQLVRFEKGVINAISCGTYLSSSSLTTDVNGKINSLPPCY